MSAPRQVLPGSTYLLTRRCTQRQFLLKPCELVNQVFAYCLAYAAERFEIDVHAFCVLSNHWHAVVTDPGGRLPLFAAWVHKYVAKALNCEYERWENFWSSEPYSAVRLVTPRDVADKIVYALANPVSSGLVPRSEQWPGLRSSPQSWLSGKHRVDRPTRFFRKDGPMPKAAELALVPPPDSDDSSTSDLVKHFQERLREREDEIRAEFRRKGWTFLGLKAIHAQRRTSRPESREPRRQLSPRIAARDKWRRIEALQRLGDFVRRYREALERWRAGVRDVIFPQGTYWMRLHHNVACAPCVT